MNRERLYRGKCVDNNEWVESESINKQIDMYGKVHIYMGLPVHCESSPKQITIEWVEVIPDTVGQYTGKDDKKGKKIFEDDIVTGLFNFGLEIKSVCMFNDGSFGLKARQCGAERFNPFASMCNIQYEVVGNIHDNPELYN